MTIILITDKKNRNSKNLTNSMIFLSKASNLVQIKNHKNFKTKQIPNNFYIKKPRTLH